MLFECPTPRKCLPSKFVVETKFLLFITTGGCLPLANNGVCVLTNLNELKSDQMEELKNGKN